MLKLKRQLFSFLWDIDPGYFHLKQAAKAILAILIVLFLVRKETLVTQAMAASACGLSMQGSFSKNFGRRVVQVLFFDVIYFTSFILGLSVRNYPNLQAITLILLGFVVNYSRRFNLQTNVAPLMTWILCFVAIILPFNSTNDAWAHLHGLILGLAVSALMMLVIFPENYRLLFIQNSNRFFKRLAAGLEAVRRYLLLSESSDRFYSHCMSIKGRLNRLLESNLNIDQGQVFDKEEKLVNEIMLHQYGLAQAFTILIDAINNLRVHNYHLPSVIKLNLCVIIKNFVFLVSSLQIDDDYRLKLKVIDISFTKFTHSVNKAKIMEPEFIMAILNLNLSLHLLDQQIKKFLEHS